MKRRRARRDPIQTPPQVAIRPPEQAGGLDELLTVLAEIVARVCVEGDEDTVQSPHAEQKAA